MNKSSHSGRASLERKINAKIGVRLTCYWLVALPPHGHVVLRMLLIFLRQISSSNTWLDNNTAW